MNKIIKNPRKGVTIVELVIALSVIAIISVAAISMLHTAVKIEVRAASIIEANNTAESIVEMFRFTEDNEEFEKLCNYFFSETITKEELIRENEENNNEDNEYLFKYTINKGAYSICINYYYIVTPENINQGYEIEIDAYHSDNKQIYNGTITFIKGQ